MRLALIFIALTFLLIFAAHVKADEMKAPAPTCGKTVEACQKAVDAARRDALRWQAQAGAYAGMLQTLQTTIAQNAANQAAP